MSLSDMDDHQFKPMDVRSLESFDKEYLSKSNESEPDFSRFKLLFEKPEFAEEEPYEFEAFYDLTKEREEIVFKPLIEPVKKNDKKDGSDPDQKGAEDRSGRQDSQEVEETPEEKGYRVGLQRGMENGLEQGQKQGFEQGFKKGEAEGFEKGEREGLEKGRQQGFEQGLKDGEEKGTQETREKAVEILNSIEELLTAADRTLELLVEKYEPRIISLIQQIARKAVMAQLEIDDDIVRPMILDALKTLVHPEQVVLSVSQEDYEYIEMIKDELSRLEFDGKVVIVRYSRNST